MKLIIGLGNPGRRYQKSRHNIGFMVVDELAKRHNISVDKKKYSSLLGIGRIDEQDVTLGCPLIYMNASGYAVAELVKGFGVLLKDILVVCDDMDLEIGVLRMRAKGSSGGHKGLASIIETLETENFARLRAGIGKPVHKTDIPEYVLEAFSKQEEAVLKNILERAVLGCSVWLTEGVASAMNRINTKCKVKQGG